MNIVFWLLIIVSLVLVWFAMSFCFGRIGSAGLKLFNGAKDAMIIQEQGETNERKNEQEN